MNKAVVIRNRFTMNGGGKWLVRTFKRQEFWKCIGCILLEVTYGKKGHKLWSEIPKSFGRITPTKLRGDFGGNTNLYQLCCDIYCPFYIYAYH